MMNLEQEIKNAAFSLQNKLKEIRTHLHQHPELSFEEYETSQFIKDCLTSEGIEFSDNWVKTGIVAFVKGEKDGSVRALRAELDALPIQELSNHDYVSLNVGKMHACGHDVHMTCLLGAAIILHQFRHLLKGEVHFIFQPGEEKLPGGASLMIEEGVLENKNIEYIIAQHVYPELQAGKVGLCAGQYMASADEIYITIIGKGGHGALPHRCIDTILVASQVVVALQSLTSRCNSATTPTVLTIGKMNSIGGATNIIPDQLKMEGTFRTMDEKWRAQAHQLIQQIVTQTCASYGATAEINIIRGYPCLYNDELLTQRMKQKMQVYVGYDNVVELDKRMTSEDFGYFSQQMPALFYRLGVRNEQRNIIHGVHTPFFDIDEKALEIGSGLMAYLILSDD